MDKLLPGRVCRRVAQRALLLCRLWPEVCGVGARWRSGAAPGCVRVAEVWSRQASPLLVRCIVSIRSNSGARGGWMRPVPSSSSAASLSARVHLGQSRPASRGPSTRQRSLEKSRVIPAQSRQTGIPVASRTGSSRSVRQLEVHDLGARGGRAARCHGLRRVAISYAGSLPECRRARLGPAARAAGIRVTSRQTCLALRALGRERTLFLLDWLQGPGLRRKVTAGLNKGEALDHPRPSRLFNRLGEIRDRSFEQQRYRASGLNLLTAAIVLWNTVYLDRTVATLTSNGGDIDPDVLRFLSPLGGDTSTSPATTPGDAPTTSNPENIGHYVARQDLSVGYITFSQATPIRGGNVQRRGWLAGHVPRSRARPVLGRRGRRRSAGRRPP